MVEQPQFPAVGIVALMALRAKCLLVLVIGFMAAVTVSFSVLEFMRTMAFFTRSNRVLTD